MLKNKLEALLFSSGRKMSIEELSKLAMAREDEVQDALEELRKEYHEKNSSTMLINEGNSWKLTVREQFLPLVRNIVTETELSKTIMETLAVIAFKYPIKQSDLIKIRTNKAYDHLKELEEMGYITRQKHGRTNLIKLTQKFFEYFDLPEGNLKDQFQDFQSIARAIEEKEKEIESIKEKQRKRAMEEEQTDERIKEQINSLDNLENEEESENKAAESLEEENPEITEHKEKLGDLEVVDEPSEEELEKEKKRIEELQEEEEKRLEEKKEEEKKPKFKGKGIQVSKDMEKIIDRKVERILHPKKEGDEGGQEESKEDDIAEQKKEANEAGEEPKDLLDASMKESQENEEEGSKSN